MSPKLSLYLKPHPFYSFLNKRPLLLDHFQGRVPSDVWSQLFPLFFILCLSAVTEILGVFVIKHYHSNSRLLHGIFCQNYIYNKFIILSCCRRTALI